MKPDRILAMISLKEIDVADNTIFHYVNLSYEVETGVLKWWFTRGIKVPDQEATVAQQTKVIELGYDVDCQHFLVFLGKYQIDGKLMDVQYREGTDV